MSGSRGYESGANGEILGETKIRQCSSIISFTFIASAGRAADWVALPGR